MSQVDITHLRGIVIAEVIGPDGEVKFRSESKNLVTEYGDRFYGERAAAIAGAPGPITGMQLGTNVAAPTKTGAGAAIGTLVPASLVALSAVPVSSLNGSSRRILYSATWAAGVATVTGIGEISLVNQNVATQTVAPTSATIARSLFSSVFNKGAADVLNVLWYHDIQGA